MLLLCLSLLVFCLCANAEHITILQEAGENVTLECSCARSSSSEYIGMYLYHTLKEQEEVLYYHFSPGHEVISPRKIYSKRVQTKGSPRNHTITITISNLTVEDSGLYFCDYKQRADSKDKCNPYILVVRMPSSTPSPVPSKVTDTPADGQCLPLTLITIAACACSMLVTLFLIMIIFPMVKQEAKSQRARNNPQVSNDNVYEVMRKANQRHLMASEPDQMLLAC